MMTPYPVGLGKRFSHRAGAFALGLAFASLGLSPDGQARSLKEAVEAALATHPQVLAADAALRAARQDLRQARAGYYPSVDLNLSEGKETTESPQVQALGLGSTTLTRREAGVTLSQKLFDGFATRSEIERQSARVQFADRRAADAREAVALRAVEVYLEILKNQQLIKLAQENLAFHRQTLEKVRLRVKGGLSQKADLQQVEARLALANSTLTARKGQLREAEANYRRVMGEAPRDLQEPQVKSIPLVKNGAIDAQLLAQAVKKATETALAHNPGLAAAEAEASAAAAAVRGAKSAFLPRVNLELSASRNKNISGLEGDFNSDSALVVMRWNLFRGGADQAQERAFTERRFAALDAAADTRRQVEERVAVALHAKATSEERLAYLEQHAKLSTEALDSYQLQFEIGRRSLLDVLNAESELFTARSNLVIGRYEDLFNQFAVEAAQGLLVKHLGITPQEASAR